MRRTASRGRPFHPYSNRRDALPTAEGGLLERISEARGTRSSPVVTNASGDFVFANVPPDTYTIEVTMPSFKTLEAQRHLGQPGRRAGVGTLTHRSRRR